MKLNRTFCKTLSLEIKGYAYDRLNKLQEAVAREDYINRQTNNIKMPSDISIQAYFKSIVQYLLKTLDIKMRIKNSTKGTKPSITKKNE